MLKVGVEAFVCVCVEAPRSAMRQKEQRGNYGPGPLLWFSGEGMGEARKAS